MLKHQSTYFLRSSSKRQKTEEHTKKEFQIDSVQFTCGEINKLPNQLLIIIFEFLNAKERICIERVCKRWNQLSQCAWSKFQSFSFQEKYFCDLLDKNPEFTKALFSRCGKWLKSVSVDRSRVCYNLLSIFSTYCPNLETVDFTGAKLLKYKSFLKLFSINCCRLKHVSFDCYYSDVNIDDELGEFFANCPHLTSLKLVTNLNLTGRCFANLPLNLKQLNLSRCFGLEDECVRLFTDRCSSLEVLNLKDCGNITGTCIGYICEKLTKLQILNLNYSTLLQEINYSFKALSNLNQLIQLHLGGHRWITDETLNVISCACPNLQVLHLHSFSYDVTDNGLSHISRLQYLSDLNLKCLNSITDVGVMMLAHRLPRLEKLNLSFCHSISGNLMVEVAECCLNLKVLFLCGCKNVTDASIQALYDKVYNRETVLTVKFWGRYISSEFKSKIEMNELQHPLLSIKFTGWQ